MLDIFKKKQSIDTLDFYEGFPTASVVDWNADGRVNLNVNITEITYKYN